MEINQSTEHKTVIPADLYDELAAETEAEAESNEWLRVAAQRARKLVVHP